MIRNGFVSNSSSSSFIIRGGKKLASKQEVIDNLSNGTIIYIGRDMWEGLDIFEINEYAQLIKNHKDRFLANAPFTMAFLNPDEYREETWAEATSDYEEFTEKYKGDIYLKDYRSLGDGYDSKYEFVKNYLLTSEEWEVANIYEDYDGDKTPASIGYLFNRTYTKDEYKKLKDKSDIFIITNEFISEYSTFIPIVYAKADKIDIDKVRDDIRFYKGFRVVKFGGRIDKIECPFTVMAIFGIIEKTKDLEIFYKKEEDEGEL